MNAAKFLDTNILLYAYDRDAPAKRKTALRLVEQGWICPGEIAISVQVLEEMRVNLERKGASHADAAQIIRDFSPWPIVNNSLDVLHAALGEQARWKIGLWDALILAAARISGASELITEDFKNGRNYDGIRAVNPFRA